MTENTIAISWAGKTETVTGKAGNYPYDCRSKDKYPNDFIYYLENGSWVGHKSLKEIAPGVFTIHMV